MSKLIKINLDDNNLDNTLKKAKELETTLLRVKELINSIALKDDVSINLDGNHLAKAIYSTIHDTSSKGL